MADETTRPAHNVLLTLRQREALEWHLTSNHYPPLPVALVPIAEQAIDLASAGAWDTAVAMPEGIAFRGRDTASVSELVESMHLDDFVASEDSEGE